jgi:hypothetical protein
MLTDLSSVYGIVRSNTSNFSHQIDGQVQSYFSFVILAVFKPNKLVIERKSKIKRKFLFEILCTKNITVELILNTLIV